MPRTEDLIDLIRRECQTHYQTSPVPSSQSITLMVQHAARTNFGGLVPEYGVPTSGMKVDLFDTVENVAHELMFGDGSEIFKNVIKGLIAGCGELVVYARPYPHRSMSGFRYAQNQLKGMVGLPIKVRLVDFMCD